ncbi:MAG: hypothetical protein ACC645_07620 [Pirellulales bacterium]
MGAWLTRYGDGVYGTRGGPFQPGRWGASTCKEDKIYLFVMRWPAEGPLELPAIKATIRRATSLSGKALKIDQNEGHLTVDMSTADRDEIATVIQLTVDCRAFAIAPVDVRQ